jgi:hypothetical protein
MQAIGMLPLPAMGFLGARITAYCLVKKIFQIIEGNMYPLDNDASSDVFSQ